MLPNPVTPAEIAAHPEDFFGRGHELVVMERSIMQGSIAIRGAIGIGKSSLLARTRLLMEGFDSTHKSERKTRGPGLHSSLSIKFCQK